jgi:putative GTP pyrophosphokinase
LHDYCPIEHTNTRLKTPESILNKLRRKGGNISLAAINEHVKDIAGMRITCSFLSDVYQVSDMLQKQSDIRLLEVKDYIRHPKPNGYQSLHLLIELPIFLSDRVEKVCVEVQIRTIAMDFWASLEHKIFYKYDGAIPVELLDELKQAANTANALDHQMERLMKKVEDIKSSQREAVEEEVKSITVSNRQFQLPAALVDLLDMS